MTLVVTVIPASADSSLSYPERSRRAQNDDGASVTSALPDQLLHGAELLGRVHAAAVVAPGHLCNVDVASGVNDDAVGRVEAPRLSPAPLPPRSEC